MPRANQRKEISRRDGANSHPLAPGKITDVVGHDVLTSRRERQLQNHIVVRVWKKRSPMKVNLLQVRLTRQHAEETEHRIRRNVGRKIFRARQRILPLGIE
jgi:hypothetical protein